MKRAATLLALFAVFSLAGAAPITVGQTLNSQKFEWKKSQTQRWAGTYGQYEVGLEAGKTYEIFTSNIVAGTSGDPFLYLFAPGATTPTAQDDDSGGANNSKIVYTATSTGTHLIRLRSYSKNKYGTCSLTLKAQNPPPPTTEPELHPGDILFSQIFEWQSAFANRQDGSYGQYYIQMTAGSTYNFETSDSVGGGNDTYLYLLDSNFTVVKSDDDSGEGYHSKLTFSAPANGLYHLRLRAYSQGASGSCTLKVTGSAPGTGNPLYPDLITWVNNSYLKDAYIANEGGVKKLRFSNAVANRGAGPLELYGVVNSTTGETQAYQVVYNDNGSQTTYLVGTFSFAGHESHGHWHFDDFAIYELRTQGGTLVASSDKISFCLLDLAKYTAENIPGSPSSGVYSCSNQGISVGWADVYSAGLEGQWINIAGVADGTYVLRSITDPLDRLHEEPNTNNIGQVTITISGNTVTVQP